MFKQWLCIWVRFQSGCNFITGMLFHDIRNMVFRDRRVRCQRLEDWILEKTSYVVKWSVDAHENFISSLEVGHHVWYHANYIQWLSDRLHPPWSILKYLQIPETSIIMLPKASITPTCPCKDCCIKTIKNSTGMRRTITQSVEKIAKKGCLGSNLQHKKSANSIDEL